MHNILVGSGDQALDSRIPFYVSLGTAVTLTQLKAVISSLLHGVSPTFVERAEFAATYIWLTCVEEHAF